MDKIPLHEIFMQIRDAHKCSDDQVVDKFIQNQIDLAHMCGMLAAANAVAEDEMTGCVYRSIAEAALELSMCRDRGISPEDTMKRAMLRANESQFAKLDKLDKNCNHTVSHVTFTNEGAKVKDITDNPKKIKETLDA